MKALLHPFFFFNVLQSLDNKDVIQKRLIDTEGLRRRTGTKTYAGILSSTPRWLSVLQQALVSVCQQDCSLRNDSRILREKD